jgi:two-component system response regulator AtoC
MCADSVLIVDDEANVRQLLYEIVHKEGYGTHMAASGREALEIFRSEHPDVVILDIQLPGMNGMEVFDVIRAEKPDTAVIFLTARGTVDTAVHAMGKGAFDYLIKPSHVTEIRKTVNRAFESHRRMKDKKNKPIQHVLDRQIIGKSPAMQQVFKMIGQVAGRPVTVLITGESGSGKEIVAKTIHYNSNRCAGPFVRVNCGALPENLMESELFGYERGAFTGAVAKKAGRFELAHNGTILLDEIGELSLPLQVKLLRVLQEREFERVGGTETIKVDVRIIAATNSNLEEMVRTGTFRQDLYYRLNVVPIHVPPLRERPEDIPLFIDYYISKFAQDAGIEKPAVLSEARAALMQYDWPGNVRELSNVIERAVLLSRGVIGRQDIHFDAILPAMHSDEQHTGDDLITISAKGKLKDIIRCVEKQIIERSLREHHGNRMQTAAALGISRRALIYKIEEYQLANKSIL